MARPSNEELRALAPQVDLDRPGYGPVRDPKWGWVLGNVPGSAAYIGQDLDPLDLYIQKSLEDYDATQNEVDPFTIVDPGKLIGNQ